METSLVLKGIGMALLGAGLFLLVIFVIMRLWNWLIPPLFKGPRLQFAQALGMFVLVRLLVGVTGISHGGFRPGGHGAWRHKHVHHRWHQPRQNPTTDPRPSTPVPTAPGRP